MHPSSMENMKRAKDLLGNRIEEGIEILDVGGRALVKDRERSYRVLWEDKAKEYYGTRSFCSLHILSLRINESFIQLLYKL